MAAKSLPPAPRGSGVEEKIMTAALTFAQLLTDAVAKPGIISAAYSAFHNYSLGNQLAAAAQLQARGIEIGPIASFMSWKEKGRSVKKGSKAIALCMPVTCKYNKENEAGETEEHSFAKFAWKNNWFVLSETEGQDFAHEAKTAAWDATKAMETLDITQIAFSIPDGNCQGFASGRTIAINPVAALPHKTRFHEMAHIVLGHTTEGRMHDDDSTPRDVREVEAEGTAYILCALLALPGLAESRGYVQSWLAGAEISERSAQRIYKAADTIFKAGQ
jgi:hypothetical protein